MFFKFLFYNTLIRVRENSEYMMCLMSILTFKRCKSVSLHLPWNCINSAHHTVFISARVSNIDRDLINLLKHILYFWLEFPSCHMEQPQTSPSEYVMSTSITIRMKYIHDIIQCVQQIITRQKLGVKHFTIQSNQLPKQ